MEQEEHYKKIAKLQKIKNKQKSFDDVLAEAISGADSKPRGKWVLAEDLTCTAAVPSPPPPPRPGSGPRTWSICNIIAAGFSVASVVGLLGYELWNRGAYPDDPDPGLAAGNSRDKGKKIMKQPGNSPHSMLRQDFEENPNDYFRKLRGKRT